MVELGVFMPVGNNGWIMSETAPQYMPTWELNRDITLLSEEIGLDYVFSMAKWGGNGGKTHFWEFSIESLTLMSALAPLTHRLRLIGSVSPTLIHPAVFAKMAATLDHISQGRFTLNIVSAGNIREYAQMGLYPDDFLSYRYEFTEEWIRIAKALWSEPSVTFHGKYFTLDDCRSDPKPLQRPRPPIVCATTSERGMQFVVDECDAMFIGGNTERIRGLTDQLQGLAAQAGRKVVTHALILLIMADTDAEAQALVDHYREGADWEAMANVYLRKAAEDGFDDSEIRERLNAPRYLYYQIPTYVGGPETIANALTELALNGADGLVLTFHDYMDGLQRLHRDVMPILKSRGLLTEAGLAATA